MNLFISIGNYIAIFIRKHRLSNHSFSLISNNCIGGFMMHGVKEEFRSPTVNLLIHDYQFCTFCKHLKEYSECPVEEPDASERTRFKDLSYPVGILRGRDFGLPDIVLYFMHYKTFDAAKIAWEKRFKRVNFDNIFIVFNRDMEAREETLDEFQTIPYVHKVFITHRNDPSRWGNTVYLKCFNDDYQTGDLYKRHWVGLACYYLFDEFDYVKWLNTGSIRMRRRWTLKTQSLKKNSKHR